MRMIWAIAVLMWVLPQAAATTERRDSAQFDVYLKGIKLGILAFDAIASDTRYSAVGKLHSTGLIGHLLKVRYDAKVQGVITEGKLQPVLYEESADTGSRQSQSTMEYRAGVPQVKKYEPVRRVRDNDVKPATQGGTLDPMSAIYATLRDTPEVGICEFKVFMFDGRRRSQLSLTAPEFVDDTIICSGEYRRLLGFSKADMEERSEFPFMLTYEKVGEGMWRAVRIETSSLYGNAVLQRR